MKTQDKTAGERVARYEANQSKRGLTRVHVWIPKDDRARLLKYAERLRKNRGG